ncbi:hypothetical protein J6590_016389 [Homalodisca vitripennis]|nr:hypothetical protein J6590_016389 [Homalodisca vitripennis]
MRGSWQPATMSLCGCQVKGGRGPNFLLILVLSPLMRAHTAKESMNQVSALIWPNTREKPGVQLLDTYYGERRALQRSRHLRGKNCNDSRVEDQLGQTLTTALLWRSGHIVMAVVFYVLIPLVAQ